MKLKTKNLFGFLGVILFVISFSLTINAIDIDNCEIKFQENTVYTATEKEIIKDIILNGDTGIETYGLKCTLFGHDYKTEYVTVIQHKVRTNSPRCKEEMYQTKICADCSDTEAKVIGMEYIFCCE